MSALFSRGLRVLLPDYQVTLDVVRCDGRLGDTAWLKTRWSIFKGSG